MSQANLPARRITLGRIGAASSVLGGLIWSATFLANLSDRATSSAGTIELLERAAFVTSPLLLAIAVVATQVCQMGRIGTVGWAGFVLVEVALAIALGDFALAGDRRGFLAHYAYMYLLPIGAILFAIGMVQGNVFLRAAAVLVGLGSLGPLIGVVVGWGWAATLLIAFGIGWVWIGSGLWAIASSTADAQQPPGSLGRAQ